MNRLRITPLNYLLSCLLTVWGGLPPGFVHSHEGGGDTGHRHDGQPVAVQEGDDHGHSHDGELHQHCHHPRVKADTSLLGSLVNHLHWEFFGIDLSMPLPADGHRGDPVDGQEPVLLRLTDETPGLGQGVEAPATFQVTISEAKPDCAVVEAAPSRTPGAGASIPLCDSARFERSGVLLS